MAIFSIFSTLAPNCVREVEVLLMVVDLSPLPLGITGVSGGLSVGHCEQRGVGMLEVESVKRTRPLG